MLLSAGVKLDICGKMEPVSHVRKVPMVPVALSNACVRMGRRVTVVMDLVFVLPVSSAWVYHCIAFSLV